jgi:hypothetical protein
MKNLFFLTLIFLILIGCAPKFSTPVSDDLSPTVFMLPSVTATKPSITQTLGSIPVLTSTATVSQTILSPKDFDVSSIFSQTSSPASQCPVQNNSLVPDFAALFDKDTMYDKSVERNIEQPVLDFLNDGGTQKAVIDAFNKGYEETIFKSFQQDITNDNVPELVIDESLIYIFRCKNGQYVLLLKIDPGGTLVHTNILFIKDMNLNGMPDLVISEWIGDINLYVPETYRILEWDGSRFKDLIIQPEFESRYGAGKAKGGKVWIDGVWSYTPSNEKQVEISDIDKNGSIEFILRGGLPGHPDTQRHGPWRGEKNIYMWNGEGFVVYSVEPAPPTYRFQAVQDADYAFFDGDYDKAVTLYQEVIFGDKLDWWSTDRWFHNNQTLDAMYFNVPTPTLLPPDESEYNYLSAYARYRIMLIYVKRGWLPEAKVIYDSLPEQYPVGKEGHVIAELATVFWNELISSNNLFTSCSEAIDFTNENVFEIFNYVSSVKTDESYDWTYHGWQKTHNYIVDDICPFK